jgi:glutathione S-transferase
MSLSKSLSLYQYGTCPFCMRVRSAAHGLGIELELRDTIASPEYSDEVFEATGRRTVPVLRIEEEDGSVRWLPESNDIVQWLEERYGD